MRPAPLWRRYARFFGPDPAADVRDELRFHLEAKIDDLVTQGWHPEAARKEAERQFGDLSAIRHIGESIGGKMERRKRLRDYWSDSLLDARYTFRTLGRDPGFAVITILILALAVGANIAVFSVVNTLLLRPLPFPNAQQLVWIVPPPTECGLSCATYTADAYEELHAQNRAFQDVTGYFAFSSDGRYVAFSVRQQGKPFLYIMQADGTNARIVADSLDLQGAPAWAPDGQSITSAANDRGTPHLFRVPIDGSLPRSFCPGVLGRSCVGARRPLRCLLGTRHRHHIFGKSRYRRGGSASPARSNSHSRRSTSGLSAWRTDPCVPARRDST